MSPLPEEGAAEEAEREQDQPWGTGEWGSARERFSTSSLFTLCCWALPRGLYAITLG